MSNIQTQNKQVRAKYKFGDCGQEEMVAPVLHAEEIVVWIGTPRTLSDDSDTQISPIADLHPTPLV